MSLKPFKGPGSTPARRRFWDNALNAVLSLRKIAGRNATVSEHQGKGSVIDIADTSARRPPTSGGSSSGGATVACCFDDGTCDDLTASECEDAGGNSQGSDTACDDPDIDCPTPSPCCADGFAAFDGSGRKFLTKTVVTSFSHSEDNPKCGGTGHFSGTVSTTDVYSIDPVTCDATCTASGSIDADVTVSGNGAPPSGEVHCHGTRSICGETTVHLVIYDCAGNIFSEGDVTQSDVTAGCAYYPSNGCLNPTGSFTEDTTATTCTLTFDIGTVVSTLSDEIICPGMSPPP
jgi:hypothetical protein